MVGAKNNRTKALFGPIICLMRRHLRMSSWRSAPTFTLNLVQPLLSASVQSCRNTQLTYSTVVTWMGFVQLEKWRVIEHLFELLVWVANPCAGGGVGRITLFPHLMLWRPKEEERCVLIEQSWSAGDISRLKALLLVSKDAISFRKNPIQPCN